MAATTLSPIDGLTFVLASCQYPPGLLDRDVAEASYARLAQTKVNPAFVLLVGDQVYVDATAGLFDPTARYDRFAAPNNNMATMLTRLGIYRFNPRMMLDDHEIEDNWEPLAYDSRPDPTMVEGRRYYLKVQRKSGPNQTPPTGDSGEPLWCVLQEGHVFLADTRTERTARTAETIETARIMSHAQFEALLRWLAEPRDGPKFVASPSILLPRRLQPATPERAPRPRAFALRSDAWDGYPWSMERLLAFIVENEIRNVVFLSGDEHLSCVAQAEIRSKNKSVPITSVHSSPLYGPFPFANSVQDDLAYEDSIDFDLEEETLVGKIDKKRGPGPRFDLGGSYSCKITRCDFAPGDGFAVINVKRASGGWKLRCEFDRDPPRDPPHQDYDL
jgi:cholesterol oxidase